MKVTIEYDHEQMTLGVALLMAKLAIEAELDSVYRLRDVQDEMGITLEVGEAAE